MISHKKHESSVYPGATNLRHVKAAGGADKRVLLPAVLELQGEAPTESGAVFVG